MFNFSDDELVLARAREILDARIMHKPVMKNEKDILEYLRLLYAGKDHEEFHVLFINASGELAGTEILGRGSQDTVEVHNREIAKSALRFNATSVVLSHNHPSGTNNPSDADIEGTSSTADLLDKLEIKVLDHYVVGETGARSLRREYFEKQTTGHELAAIGWDRLETSAGTSKDIDKLVGHHPSPWSALVGR